MVQEIYQVSPRSEGERMSEQRVCEECGYPLCGDCGLCSWHCPDKHCECPDTWHYEEDEDQ